MAAIELSLFDWRDVDARSDLDRFYLVRDHLPETRLVQYLEVMRGSGRDDYPVAAMWHAVVAGVVFQHPSIEALIRALGRNPALRQARGFAVLPFQKKPLAHLVPDADTGRMTIAYAAPEAACAAVPGSWNFSRCLANVIALEEPLGMVSAMSVTLREQLMGVLPEFVRHLGQDGKAIDSHSTGRVSRRTGETSDPDADWGKHATSGGDATGKAITRPLLPARVDTIVHTEKGSVHCICPHTGEQRDRAFHGFAADRNAPKYRCPAAAYGLDCQGRQQCHDAGGVTPGDDGRIMRISLADHDRRSFVPTPHGSPSWARGYHRRSALARINNRSDNSFGFERHFIRGLAKMQTRVGLALAVMMAMALGHVNAGRLGQLRSLVQPIPATG